MARRRKLEALTFWVTLAAAAVLLVPCLVLPPWLEHQAQCARRAAADAYIAALQRRLTATEKQIEHIHNDPAYVLRLAEEEFGNSIELPHSETIRIAPSPPAENELDGETGPSAETDERAPSLPELATFIDRTLERYPQAYIFVDHRTRPVLLVVGGVLLVTAVVFLGRAGLDEEGSVDRATRRH